MRRKKRALTRVKSSEGKTIVELEGIGPACRLSKTKNPHEGEILGGQNDSGAGGD